MSTCEMADDGLRLDYTQYCETEQKYIFFGHHLCDLRNRKFTFNEESVDFHEIFCDCCQSDEERIQQNLYKKSILCIYRCPKDKLCIALVKLEVGVVRKFRFLSGGGSYITIDRKLVNFKVLPDLESYKPKEGEMKKYIHFNYGLPCNVPQINGCLAIEVTKEENQTKETAVETSDEDDDFSIVDESEEGKEEIEEDVEAVVGSSTCTIS